MSPYLPDLVEVLAVACRASKLGCLEAPLDWAGRNVAVETDSFSIGDDDLSGALK